MDTKDVAKMSKEIDELLSTALNGLEMEIDEEEKFVQDAPVVEKTLAYKKRIKDEVERLKKLWDDPEHGSKQMNLTQIQQFDTQLQQQMSVLKKIEEHEATVSDKLKKEVKHLQKDDDHSIHNIKKLINEMQQSVTMMSRHNAN